MWYKGVFIFMPALYSYSNAFGYLFIIINLLVGNKVQGLYGAKRKWKNEYNQELKCFKRNVTCSIRVFFVSIESEYL